MSFLFGRVYNFIAIVAMVLSLVDLIDLTKDTDKSDTDSDLEQLPAISLSSTR